MAALYVLLMAMAPVVELRGAIPLGLALGLTPVEAFLWAVLGNLLVVPFLLWLWPWLFDRLERWPRLAPLLLALETRVRLKGEEQVQRYGAFGLFFFVAVPLPGTGAWSGSLLAALLGVKKRYAAPAIVLGVLAAGVLVTLAASGVLKGLAFLVR